jgi:hypothetical protein
MATKTKRNAVVKAEDLFSIVETFTGKQVKIKDKELRYFLCNVVSSALVGYGSVTEEDDTDAEVKGKERHGFPVISFVNQLQRMNNAKSTAKSYDRDGEEWAGFAGKYQLFIEAIEKLRDVVIKEAELEYNEGVVSFGSLNVIFEVGKTFAFDDGEEVYAMTISKVETYETMMGLITSIVGSVYAHDGNAIVSGTRRVPFYGFAGKLPLSEIGVINLDDEVKSKLMARGRRYLELTNKPAYVQHVGSIIRRTWFGPVKFNGTGRAMIDVTSMNRAIQNYGEYYGDIKIGQSKGDKRQVKVLAENVTDEILMALSPYVYGFSLVSKTWGEMKVDSVSEVVFRNDAYEKLVLEADTKDLILSLVESDSTHSTDFIDGKGGGCIFLLHGPPGVGKTLTAESVAEKLKRPLYSVGIGELGTNVASLEQSLTRILETASTWGAVLLIDEADIFLEERNDNDIERNAMVGVFLRLLEYYHGILFLTSNRAKRIDTAFYSRISLSINYLDQHHVSTGQL